MAKILVTITCKIRGESNIANIDLLCPPIIQKQSIVGHNILLYITTYLAINVQSRNNTML